MMKSLPNHAERLSQVFCGKVSVSFGAGGRLVAQKCINRIKIDLGMDHGAGDAVAKVVKVHGWREFCTGADCVLGVALLSN